MTTPVSVGKSATQGLEPGARHREAGRLYDGRYRLGRCGRGHGWAWRGRVRVVDMECPVDGTPLRKTSRQWQAGFAELTPGETSTIVAARLEREQARIDAGECKRARDLEPGDRIVVAGVARQVTSVRHAQDRGPGRSVYVEYSSGEAGSRRVGELAAWPDHLIRLEQPAAVAS